jgi:two-component system, NarL family, nitrate/nitrite response regulator NarL
VNRALSGGSSQPAAPLHVLIADDHALIADMLELFLGQLGRPLRVSKATTMPQALAMASAADDLNLALLDLNMPGMDGIAGLRHLRQHKPDLPIAILTGQGTPDALREAMALGASGFIAKTMGGPAILEAIRRILAGERYLPDSLGPGESERGDEKASPGPALSPREREVLSVLIEGCSNKEIARQLGIEVVTVTLHLGNIYRKLRVTGRTQAVRRALDLRLESL